MEGHHYLECDDLSVSLKFSIEGFSYTLERIKNYNEETRGGVLDVNQEYEFTWGQVLVAMQVYINMTVANCFIVMQQRINKEKFLAGDYNMVKEQLKKFQKECYRQGELINGKHTKIELINALANYHKHQNDLAPIMSRIIDQQDAEVHSKGMENLVFQNPTKMVLNSFELLKLDDCVEMYPVLDGAKILDQNYNISNIVKYLVEDWRHMCWEFASKKIQDQSV